MQKNYDKIQSTPYKSRVGTIYPNLFDCSFDYGSVWYEHNGGKLLSKGMFHFRTFSKLTKVYDYVYTLCVTFKSLYRI